MNSNNGVGRSLSNAFEAYSEEHQVGASSNATNEVSPGRSRAKRKIKLDLSPVESLIRSKIEPKLSASEEFALISPLKKRLSFSPLFAADSSSDSFEAYQPSSLSSRNFASFDERLLSQDSPQNAPSRRGEARPCLLFGSELSRSSSTSSSSSSVDLNSSDSWNDIGFSPPENVSSRSSGVAKKCLLFGSELSRSSSSSSCGLSIDFLNNSDSWDAMGFPSPEKEQSVKTLKEQMENSLSIIESNEPSLQAIYSKEGKALRPRASKKAMYGQSKKKNDLDIERPYNIRFLENFERIQNGVAIEYVLKTDQKLQTLSLQLSKVEGAKGDFFQLYRAIHVLMDGIEISVIDGIPVDKLIIKSFREDGSHTQAELRNFNIIMQTKFQQYQEAIRAELPMSKLAYADNLLDNCFFMEEYIPDPFLPLWNPNTPLDQIDPQTKKYIDQIKKIVQKAFEEQIPLDLKIDNLRIKTEEVVIAEDGSVVITPIDGKVIVCDLYEKKEPFSEVICYMLRSLANGNQEIYNYLIPVMPKEV